MSLNLKSVSMKNSYNNLLYYTKNYNNTSAIDRLFKRNLVQLL